MMGLPFGLFTESSIKKHDTASVLAVKSDGWTENVPDGME